MKVRCHREGLLSAVQLANVAVPARGPKPILQNLKAIAEGDRCTLLATDLELGIRLEVRGVRVEEPGREVLRSDLDSLGAEHQGDVEPLLGRRQTGAPVVEVRIPRVSPDRVVHSAHSRGGYTVDRASRQGLAFPTEPMLERQPEVMW